MELGIFNDIKSKERKILMEILVLNTEEMKEVIDIKEAIEADKIALREYSAQRADIPLRVNLDVEKYNGQSLYMPGYLESENALGVKVVSVYPDNIKKGLTGVPALMMLVDDKTGFPNCMMDGTYLTQLRTGAVAGAGTDLLAKKDSSVFTLIGTGGQGVLQLESVLAVRDIKVAYVFDINAENRKKFAEDMQEKFGEKYKVEIRDCHDLEAAIRESDIITSVTTARGATFKSEWVKNGAHINGVGSYTPEMAEIDGDLIIRADKVYCDTKDAVVESGDFVQIIQAGKFSEDKIDGELGELVAGKTIGRENDEDITFFETTGNAVLDIVVAKKIYDGAKSQNIGNIISM